MAEWPIAPRAVRKQAVPKHQGPSFENRHEATNGPAPCRVMPGTEVCGCGEIHANQLPSNNVFEIPTDYYENIPGWTAQVSTRIFASQQEEQCEEKPE